MPRLTSCSASENGGFEVKMMTRQDGRKMMQNNLRVSDQWVHGGWVERCVVRKAKGAGLAKTATH